MEFIIVTGMSGAGKSQAVNALEDIGFFCVDNMPPKLIPKVAELCLESGEKKNHVAVVTDLRGGNMFDDIYDCLKDLKEQNIPYKILFLDAGEPELSRRFRETRRKHPLAEQSALPVSELIHRESELLRPVRERADYVIDTTFLSNSQLKDRISKLFLGDHTSDRLGIHCMSFGFKYGQPAEADLMFDVRCFPNPYYIDELRNLTGLDKAIRDYVLSSKEMKDFLKKLFDLIDFLTPLYVKEGKSQLVIAIGCTGGKHRSVVSTEMLYQHLLEKGLRVSVNHRDITKT